MYFGGIYASPWLLIITVVTMLLGMLVQARLKSKFAKYSKLSLRNGMSGQEIAERMLRDNGITDVRVISVRGQLTDHYNPGNKTVNLSEVVFNHRNAAAAAVAAHECGHAIQHARGYAALKLRSAMVPMVSIASKMYSVLAIIGLIGVFAANIIPFNTYLYLMIAVTGAMALFSLVTLPVEFDASRRALAWVQEKGIVTPEEYRGSKDALFWAAMTYVVAAVGAVAQLMYYVMLLLGRRD